MSIPMAFIEATSRLNTSKKYLIAIDDISYFFSESNGYCSIVLRTNGTVIETGYSYASLKKILHDINEALHNE